LDEHFGIAPESISRFAAERIARPLFPFDLLSFRTFKEICTEFHGEAVFGSVVRNHDDFGAVEFHLRCDGHTNILNPILGTDEHRFGSFTPTEWEDRISESITNDSNCLKVDDNLRIFLFSCTPLDLFIQIRVCSTKEYSRYLQTLLLLGDTFRLDDLVAVSKNNRIYSVPSDWNLELTREVIFD
jgi:hypothetical protein